MKKTNNKSNFAKVKNIGQDNQRHNRAMTSLKEASKNKRVYKKGESPSENRAKLLKEWRDSWFMTKD